MPQIIPRYVLTSPSNFNQKNIAKFVEPSFGPRKMTRDDKNALKHVTCKNASMHTQDSCKN